MSYLQSVSRGRSFFLISALFFSCMFWQKFAYGGELLDYYNSVISIGQDESSSVHLRNAMESRVKTRRSALYPSLSLMATEARRKQDISSSGSSLIRSGSVSFNNSRRMAVLKQAIFDPSLNGELALAKVQLNQVRQVVDVEKQQAIKRFFLEFADASMHKSINDSYQRAINRMSEEQVSAEKKFEHKLVTIHELSTIKLHVLNLKKNSRFNKAQFDNQMNSLTTLSGKGAALNVTRLQNDIDIISRDLSAEKGQALLPDIEIANLGSEISVLEQEIKNERAKRLPTISAVGLYEFDDAAETVFGGDNRVSNYEVGLVLEWKLFQGGHSKHAIQEANHLKLAKQAEINSKRAHQKSRYGELQNSFKQSAQLSKDEQQIVLHRESVKDAIEKGYRGGTETLLAMIDAVLLYEESLRQYEMVRYQALRDFIELKSFVGGFSNEDAAAIDRLFQI